MTGPEITFTVEITASTIDTAVWTPGHDTPAPLYIYRAEATARRANGYPELAAYQFRSGWTPGLAASAALRAVEVELAKQAEQARWLAEEERLARQKDREKGNAPAADPRNMAEAEGL